MDKPVALSGGKEDEVWTKETESSEPSIYPTPATSNPTVTIAILKLALLYKILLDYFILVISLWYVPTLLYVFAGKP